MSDPRKANKKVCVFIDVQNVYYTCREVYQRNFDYNAFWARITQDSELVSAIAYATDRGDAKQMQFQHILHSIGFTVKLRPVLKRLDGTTKADWDVGITLDVYEQASECDEVILVTGDGDFDVLLERVRNRFGTTSEVYGVPSLTSKLLIDAADKFTPIDESLLLR